MKAFIAILAKVRPIETLRNLIAFTTPWDFEKESLLYESANDPRTANDAQIGPQMIPDRK